MGDRVCRPYICPVVFTQVEWPVVDVIAVASSISVVSESGAVRSVLRLRAVVASNLYQPDVTRPRSLL